MKVNGMWMFINFSNSIEAYIEQRACTSTFQIGQQQQQQYNKTVTR